MKHFLFILLENINMHKNSSLSPSQGHSSKDLLMWNLEGVDKEVVVDNALIAFIE